MDRNEPSSAGNPASPSWQDALWLVAVWYALFLTGLGAQELRLEEPRRVEPALGMIESGNWAVSTIGGEAYYRKPPFLNWLIAASFQATGVVDEFTARLPSATMVLLLALTAWRTGRSWLGREGAFGAGLILLTTIAVVDKGRLAEIEAAHMALTGMACAVWLEAWAGGRLSAGRWAATGLLLGLALLAKGPAHLPFFLGLVVLCQGLAGSAGELRRGRFWLGVSCLLLPALLWLLAIRGHWQAAAAVWQGEVTDRFQQATPWTELLLRALREPLGSVLNLMPWALLALAFVRPAAWKELDEPQRRFVRAAGWLALVTIVLLPAVPGYRPRYSMPVYGPVLMALALGGERLRQGARGWSIWWRALQIVGLLAALAGAAGAVMSAGAWRWTAVAGAVLAVVALRRGRRPEQIRPGLWRWSALVLAAAGLAAWSLAAPRMAQRQRLRPAAERVLAQVPAGQKLLLLRPGYVRYVFYLRGRHEFIARPEDLPAQETVLLTTVAQSDTLAQRTGRRVEVLAEERLDRLGEGQAVRLLRLGQAP
ncbi:MAG: ArnT family glycosyltransferase [Limisphaerales bacterium]